MDGGRWMVDGGRWTMDGGLWAVDGRCGLWTVVGEETAGTLWAAELVHPPPPSRHSGTRECGGEGGGSGYRGHGRRWAWHVMWD